MALKSIIESLDQAGEYAPLYKQVDVGGKPSFMLDVEGVGGYALEDVAGLKSALEKIKNEAISLKQAFKGFEGLDAKTAREALKELEDIRNGDKNPDKIAESKIKQLDAKHREQLEAEIANSNRYKSVLDETLRKQVAIQSITASGGNADLLLPHVLSQTRTREIDGQFVVDVVNADGSIRIKDANSNMSIADLVGEMKASPTYGVAFAAPQKSGSGTTPTGATSTKSWNDAANIDDKVAIVRAKLAQH